MERRRAGAGPAPCECGGGRGGRRAALRGEGAPRRAAGGPSWTRGRRNAGLGRASRSHTFRGPGAGRGRVAWTAA